MSNTYDSEGDSIIKACACAKILHAGNGGVVRNLQAALARVCVQYAHRQCAGWVGGKREQALLDRMKDDIVRKEAEVRKELHDGARTDDSARADGV